jgi:hypothetical protein
MALVTLVLALCFETRSSLSLLTMPDLAVLSYTSLATALAPAILVTLLQRHLSAVALSFLGIIEPLTSNLFCLLGRHCVVCPAWLGGQRVHRVEHDVASRCGRGRQPCGKGAKEKELLQPIQTVRGGELEV